MTIRAPRYASSSTQRTSRGARILAIASREFRRRSTWGTLLAIALTYTGVVLTITVNVVFASALAPFTGGPTARTFETVFDSPIWPFFMLIVATAAGAGSLADDVGNRSIALYLSRPIHVIDYLVAKTTACGGWLVLAAVGPGLLALGITGVLGYVSASVAVDAALGFVATGLVAAIFFTGLSLALSSLTNRALYSGVAIFGIVLVLYIGAAVVAGLTGNAYVPYANPIVDVQSTAIGAFGLSGQTETQPLASALALVGTGIVLWVVARWRTGRVEVVSE